MTFLVLRIHGGAWGKGIPSFSMICCFKDAINIKPSLVVSTHPLSAYIIEK